MANQNESIVCDFSGRYLNRKSEKMLSIDNHYAEIIFFEEKQQHTV